MFKVKTSSPKIQGKFHKGKVITTNWMTVTKLTPDLLRMESFGEIIIERPKEQAKEKEKNTGQSPPGKPVKSKK